MDGLTFGLIIFGVLTLLINVIAANSYYRYKNLYKNTLKQSFAMTIAMGEYHMWIKDHLENYLVQQVMNSEEFITFAKNSGVSVTKLEEILRDKMKVSSAYIKKQSEVCLAKVSEPLADDINAALENQ
jgi:predicted Holliday junction resolvase-like endonuclease